MRDLDARDVISGDFLLVHGDLISNMPIDRALKAHKARRLADKNAIMTIVLREAGIGHHRTKAHGVEPVFIIDPTKNRCLHYEEMHPLQANRYVNIDPDLLNDHREMEVRTDLIDCGIDICTPDVLALWAESFDYEVPRKHYLHGVLKDYELNGKTIHTELVSHHYAARVSSLAAYEGVSRDVLGRWTYPLVPDSNLLPGQSYKLTKGGCCKENGVILSSNCNTRQGTVIGQFTSVGDGSSIAHSIIGRNCQIGKNVTIRNSFIWDGVFIGDGTTIDRAIIASEAVVPRDCKLGAGTLLSFGVRLSPGITLAENTQITKYTSSQTAAGSSSSDASVVGPQGVGRLFDASDEDDETSAFHSSLFYNLGSLNISAESISTITSETSVDSVSNTRTRLSSFTSITSSDDGSHDPSAPSASTSTSFHHDAVQGLLDCLKENGDFDSAKLEFMGLRLSNDANDSQIRRAIAVAFSKHIASLVDGDAALEASKAASQAFNLHGAEKFVAEVAIGSDGPDGPGAIELLTWMQKDLKSRGDKAGLVLAAMCQRLYTGEIIGEEGFLAWWDGCEKQRAEGIEDDAMNRVREKTLVFIEWLRNAEEESSEEDGDDSD